MNTDLIILIILYIYLILCTITDIRTRRINLKLCILFLSLGIFVHIFFIKPDILILIYNLIPGIFLLIISLLTKGAVGSGDAVIFIIMAFYMDSTLILTILFFSLLAASIFSIILLIKKYSRKYSLPFAPFITVGFTISILLQFSM